MSLSIRAVSKAFDRYPALHDASLEIAGGELVALVGPSGSGKTTLLRLIAGLEFPTTGEILFDGEDAAMRSVRDRKVGFVFQHYALFRHMSVIDNVRFGLKVRPRGNRPSEAEQRRRAEDLLDLVQLTGLGGRYPAQLSGGQRQRVALARAMAIEPKVLLLDEPFGALDAKVRKELRRWLREIHEQTGHTTVFVTHDQEEALELADRVVVMSRGRIEQVGTPDEIYDRPATAFVHGFIGEASALPVALCRGEVFFADRPIGLTAPGDGAAELYFRPHAVDLLRDAREAITGVVRGSRRIAGLRRLELEVDGAVRRVEIDVPAHHPAEVGRSIAFRPVVCRIYGAGGPIEGRSAPRLLANA
ncbi:sulfate/molybdate ABC transporter ATP-binding protein [Acuticoccus sp. I52.16.1]|uniref:sulfate/molybdate ABC transporter ATP-binding protein n=1 Tax=Acuticoccus sp. I52.16.1 TaxID=2928472 RepID=UPI001FD05A92|nr:sulfate/molybdate ABC transporter ATP-binding protein [Acuticoccus sp. I52.16.1]UOM32655.1 sulfate/molybdate ABC transporter ATP-binding protein [Acuticoccus sp. I52.16.1]